VSAQVSKHLTLIADIGATNMRLALFGGDRVVGHVQVHASNQHSSIREAIRAYTSQNTCHSPVAAV
jgi:glucokinase